MERWEVLFAYLKEYPDEMYISSDRRLAICFYPPVDGMVFILGDFSGSDTECNEALQEGLLRILN